MAVNWKRKYIPNQHGAWAMLVVPFLFGMIAGGAVWLHLLLFAFWLIAYLFTFPFLQWIKTRRLHVYGKPMIVYGVLFAGTGLALAIAAPNLLRWIPLFIPLFLVNCWYARINRERDFVNDLAAVILFSLMVFVSYELGDVERWQIAVELFVLSLLYFTGTIFFVKTIIRERNNRTYYWYSVIYHALLLIVGAVWYPPLLLIPFVILLIRAAWMPKTNITVKQSGMLEITYSILIVILVFISYA